jgi:regulator of replication initiation timing
MTDDEFRALVNSGPCVVMVAKSDMLRLLDERDALRAEVAALRLTLGGKTFSADVPEPIGCPCPGACSTVAEIVRLRDEVQSMVDAVEDAKDETEALRQAMEEISDATKKIETFHINPEDGPNIWVEGSDRFAHERDVHALIATIRARAGGAA